MLSHSLSSTSLELVSVLLFVLFMSRFLHHPVDGSFGIDVNECFSGLRVSGLADRFVSVLIIGGNPYHVVGNLVHLVDFFACTLGCTA